MNSKAFTLIELSIVIVIIGLIISGVVAGQSLVRQAKIKMLASEAEQYRIAADTFKLQYSYYPGDIMGSTFWPGEPDGNQDKRLVGFTSEWFYSWRHLELANLITGTYTGSGSTAGNYLPGTNVPEGSIENGGYLLDYRPDHYIYKRIRLVYSGRHSTSNYGHQPVMTVLDTYNLDLKIDDGIPNRGSFMALDGRDNNSWMSGDCTTPSTNPSSSTAIVEYTLATSGLACYLIF